MRQKDYKKLAVSIRNVFDKLGPKSAFQLKPDHHKALEKMAQHTEQIARSLGSINQKIPRLASKITELITKADERQLELEKHILERTIRSNHKPLLDASKARIEKASSEWSRKIFKAHHEVAVASLEAEINSMTNALAVRLRMESTLKKVKLVFLAPYVIAMTELLQNIQSDRFLNSYHAHLFKQEALDLVKGFKKSSEEVTIPQRVEDIVIQILSLPADLASALPRCLELRRKLGRLTIETDADVEEVTAYSADVEQLAARLKKIETHLDRFL